MKKLWRRLKKCSLVAFLSLQAQVRTGSLPQTSVPACCNICNFNLSHLLQHHQAHRSPERLVTIWICHMTTQSDDGQKLLRKSTKCPRTFAFSEDLQTCIARSASSSCTRGTVTGSSGASKLTPCKSLYQAMQSTHQRDQPVRMVCSTLTSLEVGEAFLAAHFYTLF